MLLKQHIVRQFAKPTGLLGGVAGKIMARRISNRIRNARTVEMMRLTQQMRVLEVGCGPGLALCDCARLVTAGRVIGLDHSEKMIAQSRTRLSTADLLDRVELIVGGVEKLEHLGERFDRVFSLNVVQFIADKHGFFEKVHAVLAAGGMCLTTYQPRLERNAWAAAKTQADAIRDNMQAAGFVDIDVAEIAAGETSAVCVSGIKKVTIPPGANSANNQRRQSHFSHKRDCR